MCDQNLAMRSDAIGRGLARNRPQPGPVERVGLSGARWVSRMRQSDAGGGRHGDGKGGCLYPCARRDQSLGQAQHEDDLTLRLSEGKGIRGNKARGRFSAEHVYGRLREVAEVFSVL